MTQETLNQIKEGIENMGFDSGCTISETDYGTSIYFGTWNDDGEYKKVRISDHDATNSVRMQKELLIHESASVEKILMRIEQFWAPERFVFVPQEVGFTHIIKGVRGIKIRK